MTGAGDASSTIRVFIALHISPAARQALAETIGRLQAAMPSGVRWVDPAGIHLTLKFLGDIDAARQEDMFQAMQRSAQGASCFRIGLSRLGMFPNERRPRVLWVGVEGELEPLRELQTSVDSAMAELGFARERRAFSPHLTLGRVRDGVPTSDLRRIAAVMAAATLAPADPWLIESVHLMQSTLTPTGAVYTSLGQTPLWKN